jgi:hypothetical protein
MRFLWLCMLFALPARAQISAISGTPYPHFELRADPPSPRAHVVAGYLQVDRSLNQALGIGHRYFYDEAAHTYYGYDIVIQPEPQAGTYRVAFYDLSIGPLDFNAGPADALDPSIWKKQPLSAMPAPRTMRLGDTLETVVFVEQSTGQKLIDSMDIIPVPQLITMSTAIGNTQQVQIQFRNFPGAGSAARVFRFGGASPPAAAATPTVSGTAREFSVDDAEMHIQQARIAINGMPQDFGSPSRLASGSLVWLYVPHHGRYILSLSPRADLGFVKAGEVRGGAVSFTIGDDQVKLESPAAIAPGDAPYVLYVLHDAQWAPTAQGQIGSVLLGSVSPGELAALTRK